MVQNNMPCVRCQSTDVTSGQHLRSMDNHQFEVLASNEKPIPLAHLVHDVHDSSHREGFPDQWIQRGLHTRHQLDQRCTSLADSPETTDWFPSTPVNLTDTKISGSPREFESTSFFYFLEFPGSRTSYTTG